MGSISGTLIKLLGNSKILKLLWGNLEGTGEPCEFRIHFLWNFGNFGAPRELRGGSPEFPRGTWDSKGTLRAVLLSSPRETLGVQGNFKGGSPEFPKGNFGAPRELWGRFSWVPPGELWGLQDLTSRNFAGSHLSDLTSRPLDFSRRIYGNQDRHVDVTMI